MSANKNPRDHGFGDSPEVKGAPVVGAKLSSGWCPNCRCTTIFAIEVEVTNPSPMLRRPDNRTG